MHLTKYFSFNQKYYIVKISNSNSVNHCQALDLGSISPYPCIYYHFILSSFLIRYLPFLFFFLSSRASSVILTFTFTLSCILCFSFHFFISHFILILKLFYLNWYVIKANNFSTAIGRGTILNKKKQIGKSEKSRLDLSHRFRYWHATKTDGRS